jgi:hypothetical protein
MNKMSYNGPTRQVSGDRCPWQACGIQDSSDSSLDPEVQQQDYDVMIWNIDTQWGYQTNKSVGYQQLKQNQVKEEFKYLEVVLLWQQDCLDTTTPLGRIYRLRYMLRELVLHHRFWYISMRLANWLGRTQQMCLDTSKVQRSIKHTEKVWILGQSSSCWLLLAL